MESVKTTYFVDAYTDGNNPSKTGGGVVIEAWGIITDIRIDKPGLTSNEAELRAIWEAALRASDGDEIRTDSQVAYFWAKNGFADARPDLNDMCEKVKMLVENKNLKLTKIPREENLAGKYIERQGLESWIRKFKKRKKDRSLAK